MSSLTWARRKTQRLSALAVPGGFPVVILSLNDGAYILSAGQGINLQLTPLPEGEEMNNPIISPDGTMVAYQTNFPGPNSEGQIRTVPISGGTPTVISADDPAGVWFVHPSWHPNSDSMIYIHGTGVSTDGSIVSVDLANPTVETVVYTPTPVGSPNGYGPYRPQYSPDGTQIAFLLFGESGSTAANEGLYVMDADGSNVNQIDSFSPGYRFDGEQFGWSPDGTLIAYWAPFSGSDAFGAFYVIEPDGTNKTQISIGLTDDNPDFSGTANKVQKNISNRCWAPDSSYVIAAARWYNGSSFLWVPWRYELDGTTDETRLSDTRGPTGDEFFDAVYRHSDSRIWFIDKVTNPARIVSLALDGTDYTVETTLGTDCDGDAFYGGDGIIWR